MYRTLSITGERERFMEIIWKNKAPYRVKIFIWLWKKKEAILTWENLQKRCWQGLGCCALCFKKQENIDHTFFDQYHEFGRCVKLRLRPYKGHKSLERGRSLRVDKRKEKIKQQKIIIRSILRAIIWNICWKKIEKYLIMSIKILNHYML